MSDRIKVLLRSNMPPVQFKLLGTLRMMVDGQGRRQSTNLVLVADVDTPTPACGTVQQWVSLESWLRPSLPFKVRQNAAIRHTSIVGSAVSTHDLLTGVF